MNKGDSGSRVHGSALPLAAKAASLITKVTLSRGVTYEGFTVQFSSPECILVTYLREKRQLRQANPKSGAKLAITWENEHF